MEKVAEIKGRPSVVLADDNAGMRAKVIALLGPEFDILKDVADGAELIQAVGPIKPDIAIVDITMPRSPRDRGGPSVDGQRLKGSRRVSHRP